jgi:hypothetical protein
MTLRNVSKGVLGALVFGGVVLACSGSDSGSSASGVDASKVVGDLSDAEEDQLCQEASDYARTHLTAEDRKRIACFLVAGLATALAHPETTDEAKQKCASSWNDCLNQPLEGDDGGADPDAGAGPPCDKSAMKSCKGVTVGELRACLEANVAQTKARAASSPCDSVRVETGSVAFDTPVTPAECQPVAQKCSELVNSFGGAPTG